MEKISMVNTRGRIVWVDSRNVKQAIEQGMRIFPHPKETYYPEYDEQFTKSEEQPPLPSENIEEKLDVEIL